MAHEDVTPGVPVSSVTAGAELRSVRHWGFVEGRGSSWEGGKQVVTGGKHLAEGMASRALPWELWE